MENNSLGPQLEKKLNYVFKLDLVLEQTIG